MSTLQISLAIVGGLVLAGVVAYNAWVTRRSAPRTARELPDGEAAAEAPDGDTEPTGFADPMADEGGAGERIEPILRDEPFEAVSVREDVRPVPSVAVTLNHVVTAPEKKLGPPERCQNGCRPYRWQQKPRSRRAPRVGMGNPSS